MSRQKLDVAVGLLTGHTTPTAHTFKLGRTQRQNCRLCGDERDVSVPAVCRCLTLGCKRYRTLDLMFLKPKDLENMRTNGIISLKGNTRVAIIP